MYCNIFEGETQNKTKKKKKEEQQNSWRLASVKPTRCFAFCLLNNSCSQAVGWPNYFRTDLEYKSIFSQNYILI